MATQLVHETVIGGRHDGMSFFPSNGVGSQRERVEQRIQEVREEREARKAAENAKFSRTAVKVRMWGSR